MKKLFPDDKVSKKRLLDFLDKKGFYIVLVLCIIIVGAATVFVTMHNVTPPNTNLETQIVPDEIGDSNSSLVVDEKAAIQSAVNSSSSIPANKDSIVANTSKPNSESANGNQSVLQKEVKKSTATSSSVTPSKSVAKSVNEKFIAPVFGEISFNYAMDKLAYSKTLEEWRTHSGVDIAADRGTEVKAVAGGVVSEIKTDPRLGIIVIIDHENGIKTVYANLASDDMVSTNQKVKQGETIGCVGNTANFELAEQAHLHFEVTKNDQPVDPTTYLQKK